MNISTGDVMARLVRHDAKGPVEVKVNGESVWICQCGLSRNKPYCDGSHALTQDEEDGELYIYDENRNRTKISKEY